MKKTIVGLSPKCKLWCFPVTEFALLTFSPLTHSFFHKTTSAFLHSSLWPFKHNHHHHHHPLTASHRHRFTHTLTVMSVLDPGQCFIHHCLTWCQSSSSKAPLAWKLTPLISSTCGLWSEQKNVNNFEFRKYEFIKTLTINTNTLTELKTLVETVWL